MASVVTVHSFIYGIYNLSFVHSVQWVQIFSYCRMWKAEMISPHLFVQPFFCVEGQSLAWWSLKLLSVLKGDDRVHSVHVKRAVPEHSGEIVCVRRVVEFYLMAESCVLGERVHVPFVINHLKGTRSERGDKDNNWLHFFLRREKMKSAKIITIRRWMCWNLHVRWRCRAGLWCGNPGWTAARYKWTPQWWHSWSFETSEFYRYPPQISFRTPGRSEEEFQKFTQFCSTLFSIQ